MDDYCYRFNMTTMSMPVASKHVPIPHPASNLLAILVPRFPFDTVEAAHDPVPSDAKVA
jgi:hypothetical protein